MKTFLVIIFSVALSSYGFAQEVAGSNKAGNAPAAAVFHWSETTYDFGKTKMGEPVSFEFRFSNSGFVPLIIFSAKTSCDCTTIAHTKDPVEHGASGFVRATYNASTAGVYNKTVTVTANTPEGTVQLTLKGEIIE